MSRRLVSNIRVISLDITGTILRFARQVPTVYYDCGQAVGLTDLPSTSELEKSFKVIFKKMSKLHPVYGFNSISERQWWSMVVTNTFNESQIKRSKPIYSHADMERCFRKIYQHYGSSAGYIVYPDAIAFLHRYTEESSRPIVFGVTTNSPRRSIESVLPATELDGYFSWHVSCKDIGSMKPSKVIYDTAYEEARHWVPNLLREEMLHIGDDVNADYCGARAAGMRALYLDRSLRQPSQSTQVLEPILMSSFLNGIDYHGKSLQDLENHRITSFDEVILC